MPREYQFNFELRHLIYFLEVARQLHFRKAAETLAIAQPALSRQINQLELALGTPLFTRSRRKVELTAAGRALVEAVHETLGRPRSPNLPMQKRADKEGFKVRGGDWWHVIDVEGCVMSL